MPVVFSVRAVDGLLDLFAVLICRSRMLLLEEKSQQLHQHHDQHLHAYLSWMIFRQPGLEDLNSLMLYFLSAILYIDIVQYCDHKEFNIELPINRFVLRPPKPKNLFSKYNIYLYVCCCYRYLQCRCRWHCRYVDPGLGSNLPAQFWSNFLAFFF